MTQNVHLTSRREFVPTGRGLWRVDAVFYPDTLGLGGIASIGGKVLGVWRCAPSGVQRQSPWSGGLGSIFSFTAGVAKNS